MFSGPRCPECGALVPFLRTQWGLGKTFNCKRCGTGLQISRFRATMMGLFMLTAFFFFKPFISSGVQQLWIIAGFIVTAAPVTYMLSQPERAARDSES